jgi:hypothetical protein
VLAAGCAQGLFASKKSGSNWDRHLSRGRASATVINVRLDITRPDTVSTVVGESKFSADGRQPRFPSSSATTPGRLDTHIYVVRLDPLRR